MFNKNFDFTGQLQNKGKQNENKSTPLWTLPLKNHKAQLRNIRYVVDKKNGKGAPVNAFFADLVVQSVGDCYAMFKFDHEKDMQRIAGIINQIFPNDLHTKKELDVLVDSIEKLFRKEGQAPDFLPEPLAKLMENEKFKICKLPEVQIREAAIAWSKAYFLIYKKIDAFIAGRLDGSIEPVTFDIAMSEFKGKEGNMIRYTQYVKTDEAFDPMLPDADAQVETSTDDIPF